MENEFLTQKSKLHNSVFTAPKESYKHLMYVFSIFAANIKRFLGNSYTVDEIIEAYKYVYFNSRLAYMEGLYRSNLLSANIINPGGIDFDKLKDEKGTKIFATFHQGSYRLLNSFLYEKGFKSVIIVRGDFIKEQIETVLTEIEPTLNKTKNSDVIILDVNQRSAIFKIKQLISEGYFLTAYLDGNSGLNDEKGVLTKNHVKIPFLNSSIFVRKGVAQLAYLLKLDIIPVISSRNIDDSININFLPQIEYNNYKSKDFIESSLKICFNHLQDFLIKSPWQWECWTYIHKWIDRDDTTSENSITMNKLNTSKYLPFYVGTDEFLTNLKTYKILKLKTNSINALESGDLGFFSEEELLELQSRAVLVDD